MMLSVDNITKTFNPGTVNAKTALKGLSLNVENGDFITIIGANGAGKSTLFGAIAGSFFTDSGKIILDGEDITMKPEHIRARKIGRLFQDPLSGTAPGMSVEENMTLAAGRGGWLGSITKEDRALFRDRLALLGMGLEDRLDQPVGLLSGGQRQALTLLMATINPPKLLLLDEHTAALDPAAAEKITDLTSEIVKKDKLTCLMITHNMKSALEVGNRTVMMNDGRIIYDVAGSERDGLGVSDLIGKFKEAAGTELDSDRMLLQRI
jgi:putative ABC transport system ATP-binding protein